MSHIRYTERKLDYRYMPPMQCCPFYHYSILIRIGYPKQGFQRNVFSKFWLRKLLFSTSKIKVEWERKKPVKISVKGDNFFRWKNQSIVRSFFSRIEFTSHSYLKKGVEFQSRSLLFEKSELVQFVNTFHFRSVHIRYVKSKH